MPPAEQPVRQSQQLRPDRLGRATAIDHRLEIATEVVPADLAIGPGDPIIGAKAVGHRNRPVLRPQHGLSHLGIAVAGDREDRDQSGHGRPEPGLAPVLTPRGLVGMDDGGRVDRGGQFVVGGLQRLGRLPLQFGDHAGGDRQPEQIAGQLLDLPLAQAVSPGQGGQGGLQIRAVADGGDVLGQRASGAGPTIRAGQAMQAIFVDDRFDLGEFGDLVDQGVGVFAEERVAAAAAGARLTVGGGAELLGRDRGARSALGWPGCPPRFRPDRGVGGFRFRPIGSDEGGLDELVELSWSRAWRSRTVASNSAIRSSNAFQAGRRAA